MPLGQQTAIGAVAAAAAGVDAGRWLEAGRPGTAKERRTPGGDGWK